LAGKRRVAVTSGASTPSRVTREVIQFVERFAHEEQQRQDAPETGVSDLPLPGPAADTDAGETPSANMRDHPDQG
jgi:hypothetical protein